MAGSSSDVQRPVRPSAGTTTCSSGSGAPAVEAETPQPRELDLADLEQNEMEGDEGGDLVEASEGLGQRVAAEDEPIHETEESRKPVILQAPHRVTKEEREAHELTHTPYRSWCPYCVRARGRNSPHTRRTEEMKRSGVPKVSMDYFYMSMEDQAACENPVLVVVDEGTGEKYARAVGQKGLGNHGEMDWLIKDLSDELRAWGHPGGEAGHIILKSDGERSIVAVGEALAKYHGGRVIPEHPPRGESQSNGIVEEAGKTCREYARVLKEQLEHRAKCKLEANAAIVSWLIRWAAMVHSRYAVGKDGLTPYERRRGRRCRTPMARFGEVVWFKELRHAKNQKDKFESEWHLGLWLGHSRSSNEHLVGTEKGVVRAYSIKRRDPDHQWSAELVASMQGTPQQPDPNNPGNYIPVRVQFDTAAILPDEPEAPADQLPQARRMRITPKMLDKHGYTVGCEGCRFKQSGLSESRGHTEECRARIWEALAQDEDGQRQRQRQEERFARSKGAQEEDEQAAKADDTEARPPEPMESGVCGADVRAEGNPDPASAQSDGGSPEEAAEPSHDVGCAGARLGQSGRTLVEGVGGEAKTQSSGIPGRSGEEALTRSRSRSRGRERSEERDSSAPASSREKRVEPLTSEIPQRFNTGSEGTRSRSRSRSPQIPRRDGVEAPVPDSPVPDDGPGVKREPSPGGQAASKRQRAGPSDGEGSDPMLTDDWEGWVALGGIQMLHCGIFDVSAGWDFTEPRHRDAALRHIREYEPNLVIGSVTCGMDGRRGTAAATAWRERRRHTEFVAQLYRQQKQSDKWYLHAQPATATRAAMQEINSIVADDSGYRVSESECAHEVLASVPSGQRRTRAAFYTNSQEIQEVLLCRPSSSRPDVLELGRALAEGIDRERALQMHGLRKIVTVGAGTTVAGSPPEEEEAGNCWQTAWDDVSGKELDPAEVAKARSMEMDYVAKKGVWKVIPRDVARSNGWKTIPTRWIDINKGDSAKPNYRSRLVAKEFNNGAQEGLFAATPPLEAVRLLLSQAATMRLQSRERQVVMINDIARAFFEAPVTRTVCVELPPEANAPGDCVGLLQLSLYGTRDAAANFQKEVSRFMLGLGFEQSAYNPQVYFHRERMLRTVVHGDDFITSGTSGNAVWFRDALVRRFEVKSQIVGTGKNEVREARVLGRIVRVTADGWQYEADQRHAELIVAGMNLSTAKGVATPGEDAKPWNIEDEAELLRGADATNYRALAARANYLAQDRADIQFCAKEVCRGMSSPTVGNLRQLRRLARYLKHAPRVVWQFGWQHPLEIAAAFSDSDWAGCRRTARSTSGGVLMIGSHCIRTYSVTQKVVTLSSAEAELMAMVKATTEAIGLSQLAQTWGLSLKASVFVDSSAALAIAHRKGNGKLRHVRIGHLWIQQMDSEGQAHFHKVNGRDNPADLMTKYLTSQRIVELSSRMSQHSAAGNAESRLQLASVGSPRGHSRRHGAEEGCKNPPSCPLHQRVVWPCIHSSLCSQPSRSDSNIV